MCCNCGLKLSDRCRMLKAFLLGKLSKPMKRSQTISTPSQCQVSDEALINFRSLICDTTY